jgi:hypothetical protein
MSALTEEQFIRDARLMAATHTKEELDTIADEWRVLPEGEETYHQWCGWFSSSFDLIQQAHAKEKK